MAKSQVEKLIGQMEAEMKQAARNLEFERAAALRDEIQEIRLRVLEEDASAVVGRAAERAAHARPSSAVASSETPARDGHAAKPARQVARRIFESMYMGGNSPASLDVTEVKVVEAAEEPGSRPSPAPMPPATLPRIGSPASATSTKTTAGQRNGSSGPTWDHTVTPNVIKRTGTKAASQSATVEEARWIR